jgi:hypothetical protein
VWPLQSPTPAEAAIGGNVYSESLVRGRLGSRRHSSVFLLDESFVIGAHPERKPSVVGVARRDEGRFTRNLQQPQSRTVKLKASSGLGTRTIAVGLGRR